MKLCMMTDAEGCAGVYSFDEQTRANAPCLADTRRLLTGEVNSAVEGARSAGATEILVFDGHGPGGLDYEMLQPGVQVLHGRGPLLPRSLVPLFETFDVACMIGQHAMAGTADGCLCHTQSSLEVVWYKLNGKLIGEIAQWALFMGALGVPVIFLSGDEAACREASECVAGIETAAVKKGLCQSWAVSLSKKESQKKIHEDIFAAINRHRGNPIAPLAWPGPYRLEIQYLSSSRADQKEQAGWQRVDARTVAVESNNVLDIIYG